MAVQTNPQLLIACWATLILLGAMAIAFLRAKKHAYIPAVVPLAVPAATYIISGVCARWLDWLLAFATSFQIRIILDLGAALVACLLIGFAASGIPGGKRNRILYCACGALFVIVFSGLLIMSSVVQLGTPV
ncbi:MAG: hypothetical protein IJU16_03780 [Clostridia bacterium]|nr:hypothetical protein [Clostridia bacterium]